MQFTETETTKDFDLKRFVDDTNQWEFGIHSMLFGWRVSGNRLGSDAYAFDYCASDDTRFLGNLLITMQSILEAIDPATSEYDLRMVLPSFAIKPINKDPCWRHLVLLAVNLSHYKSLSQIQPDYPTLQ